MRAVAVIAVLFFLATSLCAREPAAAANSAKTRLSRKEARHLRRVKKQALRLGKLDMVSVRLADHSRLVGLVTKVTNQGIQFKELPNESRRRKGPWSWHLPPHRFIPFGQIRSLRPSGFYYWAPFAVGSMSILGPLGWLTEWAMLTGRD